MLSVYMRVDTQVAIVSQLYSSWCQNVVIIFVTIAVDKQSMSISIDCCELAVHSSVFYSCLVALDTFLFGELILKLWLYRNDFLWDVLLLCFFLSISLLTNHHGVLFCYPTNTCYRCVLYLAQSFFFWSVAYIYHSRMRLYRYWLLWTCSSQQCILQLFLFFC